MTDKIKLANKLFKIVKDEELFNAMDALVITCISLAQKKHEAPEKVP